MYHIWSELGSRTIKLPFAAWFSIIIIFSFYSGPGFFDLDSASNSYNNTACFGFRLSTFKNRLTQCQVEYDMMQMGCK